MATEGPFLNDGAQMTASADLSAKQFFAVKFSGSRTVNVPSASTDLVYGILQNKPKSGEVADVVFEGICKMQAANAGITTGTKIMSDTAGKMVTFVGSAGNTCVGIALETVSANQVFTGLVNINYVIT